MANTTPFNIKPTDDERRAIYMDVIRRNKSRKNAQLPLIDVATTSHQEIALIRMRKFRHIAQPYIRQAFGELPSPRGLANRSSTMYQAEMMANERLMSFQSI